MMPDFQILQNDLREQVNVTGMFTSVQLPYRCGQWVDLNG
mgnify:CR=1 FL=1